MYKNMMLIVVFLGFVLGVLASNVSQASRIIVLQTEFEAAEDVTLPLPARSGLDHYLCSYCYNLLDNPQQDLAGNRCCEDCADEMGTFLLQHGADSTSTNQDENSDYYKALYTAFPDPHRQGVSLEDIMKSLSETTANGRPYFTHPDKASQKEIDSLVSKVTKVRCCDCDAENIPIREIVNHARMHFLRCPVCGFVSEGAGYTERQKLFSQHIDSCYGTCRYCDQSYSASFLSAHEPGCQEQYVKCEECQQQIKLCNYFSHIIPEKLSGVSSGVALKGGLKNTSKNKALTVKCPVCDNVLFLKDAKKHYDILHRCHSHRRLHCCECKESFFNGYLLMVHAMTRHPELHRYIFSSEDFDSEKELVCDDSADSADSALLQKIVNVYQQSCVTITVVKEDKKIKAGKRQEPVTDAVVSARDLQQIVERIETLERKIVMNNVRFSEMELQLQAACATTYSGEFLWRITEVKRRIQDAKDLKTTSIYSPPFYTGTCGYKLCLRAYLNGDGIGLETHLSIFIVVMKGGYDSLLKWPFAYKISFILLDQTPLESSQHSDYRKKHIIQTFYPRLTSASFKQPIEDMNVASGCPKFCELDKLNPEQHPYVKDDVMYIKGIIDTSRIFHP